MSTIKLNLARKWRSRTFDEVVGQQLAIRMLKNSLYLDHYFPVYLFSGQRGCGKTTAARIFAAAANCEKLSDFQKKPTVGIPCLECTSCVAMKKGNHPDFIEIDAASHTGVDNVRQIIDAAALLPLLGRKKIYLIDEAHMLSKAAFNAFLKILEEPPDSVFFILATTDSQKIIGTVTSRCFQVLFKALQPEPLVKHLAAICTQEEILYEDDALWMIIKQTEGSARDALNLLEQVRFTNRTINQQAVLMALGHLDEERLFTILDRVLNKQPQDLLNYLYEISFDSFCPSMLWRSFVDTLRVAIKEKYGVELPITKRLKEIMTPHSVGLLRSFLQIFYDYEVVFLKTKAQHSVLEHVLLKMCEKAQKSANDDFNSLELPESNEVKREVIKKKLPMSQSTAESSQEWQQFLSKIVDLDDPLVVSIFKQGSFIAYENGMVTISFPENFSFFNELLESTKNAWTPLLKKVFGASATLSVNFDGQTKKVQAVDYPVELKKVSQVVQPKPKPGASSYKRYEPKRTFIKVEKKSIEQKVDVSDEKKWHKANIILKVFPGTVTEVPEDEHA